MDCLEFRRRLGAAPEGTDPGLLAHRAACPGCAAAWERAQRFEQTLREALEVPLPEGLAERVLLAQATGERQRAGHRRRVGLAWAAGLLLALGGGGIAWQRARANSLPGLAVAHMPEEYASLGLRQPLPAAKVAAAFARRAVSLKGPLPADTTYVQDCDVGPYRTVHLVSRYAGESVAVLYVPGKQIGRPRDFRRDGWIGRELPLAHGTLVLLTDRGDRQPFAAIAADWRTAIDGLPPDRTDATAAAAASFADAGGRAP